MEQDLLNQRLNTTFQFDDLFQTWLEAFIVDRKVQNMAKGTVRYYIEKLTMFNRYCTLMTISRISQLTPDLIRSYLVYLQDHGHNPGGLHQAYRTLKTFLLWWEAETEPVDWRNPIRRVKPPKLLIEPIQPVPLEVVEKLIATCNDKSMLTLRDKALLLLLLDTGARASEVCNLNIEDIDLVSGSVNINCGKGRKPRVVFLGQTSRRALRSYLRVRTSNQTKLEGLPCWVTNTGDRLTYSGLDQIIRRRSKLALVPKPGLHDFRRAFAINFLRNGGDVYSLQRLMGHADLQVLRRYLAQTNEDLRIAHQKFSPVDNGRR